MKTRSPLARLILILALLAVLALAASACAPAPTQAAEPSLPEGGESFWMMVMGAPAIAKILLVILIGCVLVALFH